jgi:hypothetical protein
MMVSTPGEVPEYELNPGEVQFRRGYDVTPVKFPFQYKTLFLNTSSRTECDASEIGGELTNDILNRARTTLRNGMAPRFP